MPAGAPLYYRTQLPVIAGLVPGGSQTLKLFSCNHLNTKNTQYIMLFDLTQIPADGAYPLLEFAVAPSGLVSYTPALEGRKFSQGLVVALSSTPVVLTKTLIAEMTFQTESVNT